MPSLSGGRSSGGGASVEGISDVPGLEEALDSLEEAIDPLQGIGRGFVIGNSVAQTINAGATTILGFDTDHEDDDGFHFTASTAITGTVAKTLGSDQLVGTGTSFLSQLSAGQVLSIPGTTTEIHAVKSIEDDTHLTLWGQALATASGQTATRKNGYWCVPAGLGGLYLVHPYLAVSVEPSPTFVTFLLLYHQSAPATETLKLAVGITPNAGSHDESRAAARRIRLAEGDIWLAKGSNNNDSAVDIRAGSRIEMTWLRP